MKISIDGFQKFKNGDNKVSFHESMSLLNTRNVERRAGDIASRYADASKAKEKLGWEAKLSINDMVKDS